MNFYLLHTSKSLWQQILPQDKNHSKKRIFFLFFPQTQSRDRGAELDCKPIHHNVTFNYKTLLWKIVVSYRHRQKLLLNCLNCLCFQPLKIRNGLHKSFFYIYNKCHFHFTVTGFSVITLQKIQMVHTRAKPSECT